MARRARQNPPTSPEIEETIREGMARALWVEAYASFVTEHADARPDRPWPRPDRGEDWDEVAPQTPPAAKQAMQDLVGLIAQNEEMPEDEALSNLFDIAATVDTGIAYEADPAALYNQASTDPDNAPTVADVARWFGWSLASMAMGSGVSWFDDHRQHRGAASFKPKLPRFECHYDGVDLTWSGEGGAHGQRRVSEIEGPFIVTTFEVVTPESLEEGEAADGGVDEESPMQPSEDEAVMGITAVDKAMEFLHEHGDANGEPSSTSFHPGMWYSSEPDENPQTGEERTEQYHLHGFTPEQEKEVYRRWVAGEWTPQPEKIGRITVVNPRYAGDFHDHAYVFVFGEMSGTYLMVYENDMEAALEECVEWLAKHAPGLLADESVREEYTRVLAEKLAEGMDEDEAEEAAREEAEVDTTACDNGHYLGHDYNLVAEDPDEAELREIGDVDRLIEDARYSREYDARYARVNQPTIWASVVDANNLPQSPRENEGERVGFRGDVVAHAIAYLRGQPGPLEARTNWGTPSQMFVSRDWYLGPAVNGQREAYLPVNFTTVQQRAIYDAITGAKNGMRQNPRSRRSAGGRR